MARRLGLILALLCLIFNAACQPITVSSVSVPGTVLSTEVPSATPTPDRTRPPTGLTIVAIPQPTAPQPTRTSRPIRGATRVIVQGRIFDATEGMNPLPSDVMLTWQYAAADRQYDNGRLTVPADGLYRLELNLRPTDELFITAQAPGYLPSTTRLQARQLPAFGARLDFALVSESAPAPTVPGALGTIQLNGIVYNVARGLKAPVDGASIIVINHSVVQPATPLEMTSNISGTFTGTLALHATDQLNFTITAQGYLTTTLKKTATELARNPRLSIGLRPAPQK